MKRKKQKITEVFRIEVRAARTFSSQLSSFILTLALFGIACASAPTVPERKLLSASRDGDKETIESLLAEGARANVADEKGKTALMVAAENGHKQSVMLLLEAKADVNARDRLGNSALHHASQNGNSDIIRLLINTAEASVNVRNKFGQTPLHWAVRRARIEAAIDLVDSKADINAKDEDGFSPMHSAAHDSGMVNFLIAAGAKLNAQDKHGRTPLHIAAAIGAADTVNVLLAANADIYSKDDNGKTALMLATEGMRDANEREIRPGFGDKPYELTANRQRFEKIVNALKMRAASEGR